MVFFPIADGEGQVRADGFILSQMAALAAAYTPHHRLAISPPHYRDEVLVGRCQKEGETIDPAKIALVTSALETKLYILSRLDGPLGKQELTVEFHGDGKAHQDRTFRHPIGPDGLRTAPGLMARDVLEAVGVHLEPAELQTVIEPTVRNDRELAALVQVLNIYPATAAEDEWLGNFFTANPRCALGWELYLTQARLPPSTLLNRFTQCHAACDRLQISAARLQRNSGHAEEALLALLKLAPTHHGDSGYLATLTHCATDLGDERLANHLFEVWDKEEPGYAGRLAMGGLFTEWAWAARGGGWANTVTPKGWKLFRERLARAQEELEQAVAENPTGYRAHTGLIRVARGLDLPPAYMERHFREAVRAQPHLLLAYSEKGEYLLPRWHGSPEELVAFGQQCLETGAWDDDIPPICLSAVTTACEDVPDDDLITALTAGPLWDLLRSYNESAEKHQRPEGLDLTHAVFARFGVIGGHFDEVLPVYQQLEKTNNRHMDAFEDLEEYDYFCDLVQAKTGQLPTRKIGGKRDRALAQASVALAVGDIDAAEKALPQVEHGNAQNDRLAERYSAAVALGRKLKTDGSVSLSPQQVKDLCVSTDEKLWTVEGDKLTGRKLPLWAKLSLPLGLQHAVLSGVLSWEGDVMAVEMQLHARAPRHKERLLFKSAEGKVGLLIGTKVLTNEAYESGPQKFRFDLGADEEHLEPHAGVHWDLPAADLPGGFALTVWNNKGGSSVSISDLRIELKK